jgi:hypothetical protein
VDLTLKSKFEVENTCLGRPNLNEKMRFWHGDATAILEYTLHALVATAAPAASTPSSHLRLGHLAFFAPRLAAAPPHRRRTAAADRHLNFPPFISSPLHLFVTTTIGLIKSEHNVADGMTKLRPKDALALLLRSARVNHPVEQYIIHGRVDEY